MRTGKINEPAVVGTVLDMGYCLDLLSSEAIELVRKSYHALVESCAKLLIPVPSNRRLKGSNEFMFRHLDCAVIEDLHFHRMEKNIRQFDSVRCAFIEGSPLYTNSGFYAKTHIQLCVRNPNCIKGYFLPRIPNQSWPVP